MKTNIELARQCQLLDGLAVVPSQVDRYTAAVEARMMAKLLEGAGEPATFKPLGTVYRWTALKDGRLVYQYGEDGYPQLFAKTAVKLPEEPEPAQEPLTGAEIEDCMKKAYATLGKSRNLEHVFARAVEAKLREKNAAQPAQEPLTNAGPQCECHWCITKKDLRDRLSGFPLNMTKMILCPSCGNKRCPKASDHRLKCTASNEPGQVGSVYGIGGKA
jgi:hypothetical protein